MQVGALVVALGTVAAMALPGRRRADIPVDAIGAEEAPPQRGREVATTS